MMKKTGKVKEALLRTLDFLFPSLMNVIWGTYFLVYCHQSGYAIFGVDSKQEALDYLVK
jgi:hypothetical protein